MRTVIVAMSVLLLSAGVSMHCRTATTKRTSAAKAEEPKAEKIGRQAIARLKKALAKRLIRAMKDGGPTAAMEVCAIKAQGLTAEVNRALPQGVTIKRTSARVRNPANAATEAEGKVLRWFARMHGKPGAPRFKSSVSDPRPGRPAVHHYYEPITVMGLCTRCHGPSDKLAPAIKTILAKRYPKDTAVGYKSGDLRGMFHVTIPEAALR